MTQERFSTLEECCEFAVQFSKLTPKKKFEQKDTVVAMHIALTKHIDEIVNRVCTRHKLECQWQLNYGLKRSLGRGGCGKITLNPEALFNGASFFRKTILHELAHLTHLNHRSGFWREHIAYMQEENLLPQGEIDERPVIKPRKWASSEKFVVKYHQLLLNGKPIVEWYYANWREEYCSYFHNHNTELGAKLRDSVNVERAKKNDEGDYKEHPKSKRISN
ncbi:MAG: M48 family metallopeptidase [Alistipes sp.]|nr:M48 family metallopeptidase [Alistipes sp.]